MNLELKKAIIMFMLENANEFQSINKTRDKFNQYIYTPEREYCIGGEKVAKFIREMESLIKF